MNLFDAQGWAIHGNVVDSGSLRTVPIEGSFSANTNGRLEYYYDGVAPTGDTLTGHVSYTITNTDGDVWFIVMPDGSGGQYNKQLAHQGDAVPITGSFDLAVQIPEGSSFVEVGTYNQQYATSEGPAPSGYGSMGSMVVPAPAVPPVAPDESLTTIEGTPVSVMPVVTQGGSAVTPEALAVVSQPLHGAVSINGAAMSYTPAAGFVGTDSFTYTATASGAVSNIATVDVTVSMRTNCDCDDDHPTETLANLRKYLMVRLGLSAMLAAPPPGMADLLDSFLIEAQTLLYQRFRMLRLERWFTWNMASGVRFYDLPANADTCAKKLDPSRVRWVGVSQGDSTWRPLVCGIDPVRYGNQGSSIPDSYEIHQCIEVYPAPADDTWKLRIKGDFGLLPFAADDDVTTIDPQAIKLHALAYAKAHYGQPDAANHMSALNTFLGDLTAATHLTRHYVPGERIAPPAIPPKRAD